MTYANIGQTICVTGWTAPIRTDPSYTTELKVQQLTSGYTYKGDNAKVYIPQSMSPRRRRSTSGSSTPPWPGRSVKVWMFLMRLSHSGRAFHVAYGAQAQEAFLEGHVLAFQHFGGVQGRVRYDNLKPAVTRILKGRDRSRRLLPSLTAEVRALRKEIGACDPSGRGGLVSTSDAASWTAPASSGHLAQVRISRPASTLGPFR